MWRLSWSRWERQAAKRPELGEVLVRDPGYAAALIFESCAPMGALALIVRTLPEDRTLQRELRGCSEYVMKSRFRSVPGIC